MDLPFLKNKKISSIIIAKRGKDGNTMPMKEEGEEDPGLMSAAEDLLSAIAMKDAGAVAAALKAAMAVQPMDDEPMEPMGDEA